MFLPGVAAACGAAASLLRRALCGSGPDSAWQVCSKEDVKEVVKSYAEITEQSQKKAIQHAAAANSSKVVVETVFRKLDADKVERENRRSNRR